MFGVGPTLIEDKNVDVRPNRVNDFSFSLAAPLRPDKNIDLALQVCSPPLEADVVNIFFFNSEIARWS